MASITYLQAIADGLREEMRSDDRVYVCGQDVGAFGGAFKVTAGLLEEFGPERVRDTPIAEAGIIGTAIGSAIAGLRPVCEMQFADFVACGFDQLVNVAGKMHYRLGLAVPMVIRLPTGGGFSGGPFHSQNPEAWFMHAPGLKVVAPSTPEDAKGLLVAAIRDPNPVVFCEHKNLYRRVKGEVSAGAYETPMTARVARDGADLTVVAYGAMVHHALEAAEAVDGSVEVLDLRSLVPLDEEAILASVRKTSKVLILDEANATCAAGAQVAALVAAHAFEDLDGPVRRLATPDVPIPFSPPLEQAVLPSTARIREAIDDSSATDIAVIDVVMPQMGTSITEGTVVAWNKSAGETVEADEPICEISTDKIDSECPSPASGTLVEILVDVGQTVDVGTVIARLATPGAEAGKTAPPRSPTAASCTRPPRPADRRRRGFSPVVQRIAAAHGVDPATVTGTGRGGRVTRSDILVHVSRIEPVLHSESPYRPDVAPEDPLPTPSANGGAAAGTSLIGGTPEPLSRIRQLIGAAMRRSQETSATAHTVVECDMTGVERRRRSLGLTALPIVAHATVQSLREFPDLNATLNGTMITRFDRVHLGVAVSLGGEGLIVPVIWDAQDLSEEGFAERIKDLAGRARTRALGPDDVQGATFTITSPGAAGAVIATPIVPVPQVAILDLEAIVRRPVVVTDAHGAESIAIRSMANLVLGWDHRAIDGMTGAYFLAAIRQRLERLY